MITGATLFSGGGLVDLAFRNLGISTIWGVEKEEAIAEVYRQNFPESNLIQEDIKNLNISSLSEVDFLHASPPCQQHSIAWKGKTYAPESDIGYAILPILDKVSPNYFTLENVPLYQKIPVFKDIHNFLIQKGYYTYSFILNAADHGTPQDRKRLMLMASKTPFFPMVAKSVHCGWYAAVSDLVHKMEEVELNATQNMILNRNNKKLPLLIPRVGSNKSAIPRLASDPSPTIRAFGNCRAGDHWADIVTEKNTVHKISPEATARLMGITEKDDYKLPKNKQLAQKILGNGVPLPLMEAVINCVMGNNFN